METEFNLVANWQSTWAWFLSATPSQTPALIAIIGAGLAFVGLWRMATGSSSGGGKRAGFVFVLLFLIICLAPGPVVSAILYVIEIIFQTVVSVLAKVGA